MRNILIIAGLIAASGLAYYFISPLFVTIEVQDAAPVADKTSQAASPRMLAAVMGTQGHPASGTVRIIESEEQTFIRFEDFETLNGPQLHLYLSKDLEATEYVDLGPIRGTEGNINYEIPEDVDLSEYPYVMHWCVPFGVLFNYANISQQL